MIEINSFENLLTEKRGWVSQWKDKSVFIYSGGLDSTITIARLLTDKKIEIFPLFINRGQTNLEFEKKSANFFASYFKSGFGALFHDLKEININVPPKEIKDNLKEYSSQFGYPLRNTLLQMIGVQYAISLRIQGIKVTSVFCAQIFDDPFPHSTLSALRATTIDVCQSLGEWDWQITSPNIDPWLDSQAAGKKELVKWASAHDLPVEKTRSCYSSERNHCGTCLSCRRRQAAFREAAVEDKTAYFRKL